MLDPFSFLSSSLKQGAFITLVENLGSQPLEDNHRTYMVSEVGH
jgi:hypothetical protein